MGIFYDDKGPGAATSYEIAASLAAVKPSFFGDALRPVVDRTTKSILTALEFKHKLSGNKEEAWVKIMLEQEKGLGSASPRGCFPIRSELDLNHVNTLWHGPGEKRDSLYLVKNMLNQILDEGKKSAEWELRYPTVQQGKWQENLEKRQPMVRLVIGRPPPLFFVDVQHNDQMQRALNDSKLLREICEGRIPEAFKPAIKPVSEWFADTPNKTPYLALWMSDSDQSSFHLSDPRMNFMSLRVHNSMSDAQPMLPFKLNGMFAHALIDGVPAEARMATIWESALSTDSGRGVRHEEQGRITDPEIIQQTAEEVKPENPFRKGAFKYAGCEKFARALNIDEVSEKIGFDDVEMKALLKASKLLGCKPSSLFMLGLMGISGTAPVTSVATREKEYSDKDAKKRKKRIQVTTFGNKLAFDSAQFRVLANWARNPQKNVSLDQLLKEKVFQAFPQQLSKDLFQHVGLYETLVKLAQEHDLGSLSHGAAIADKRRVALEQLIGMFSPHIGSLLTPQMQFSSLGSEPTIGNGALHWEFESACSETVVNTFGLIGNELSFREFLDNPIGLFDVWQLYVQRNDSLPLELLNFTFSNGLLQPRLVEWLQRLVAQKKSKDNSAELIRSIPIEVGGVQFKSIHHALAEAGRNGAVMKDVMSFLNDLLSFTADFMVSSINKAGMQIKFQTLLQAQAHLTMRQAMVMTEGLTYTLLQQNGFGKTEEAETLREWADFHKQECWRLVAAIVPPPPSAQI
jgi:hypothetical protein